MSMFQVRVIILAVLVATGLGALAQSPVSVGEGTLTLPTYAWYDDVNPVLAEFEGRIYYPYTRQDHISKEKKKRSYKALFLENEYLKVTCLPELGGRIHSVLDKTSNEEMFHKNAEIKPGLIAMRGAWISGGIEWNVGPQGHTVTIVSPVNALIEQHEDGSASLVIGNTEKMFRTRWTVRLTLHPGKAYLDETIRMYNPTDGLHPYYFWNCTAFPNLPGTRFIYPMTLGTDHNGTSFFSWPIHEGKDITWLKNYDTMSSVFGYECVFDFFGAYDVDRDRGIVSYANHHKVRGKKAWTWGKDDFGVVSQMALSDAGPVHAQYIEVQSGPLLTQSDYGMLGPRQQIDWREFWYPVHGLRDGFEFATKDVAVQTKHIPTGQPSSMEVLMLATAEFPGATCAIQPADGDAVVHTVDLSPREANRIMLSPWPHASAAITIQSSEGVELLAYETPLAIPEVSEPDLTKKPARPDGVATAEEEYRAAYTRDSQSNPKAARAGYEKALAADPLHVPSLCALAQLDLEYGRFGDAAANAEKALKRNPDDGQAAYLLGAARLWQERYEDARTWGYAAARTSAWKAAGLNLAGRALMRMGRYEKAAQVFGQSLAVSPQDTRTRNQLSAARYATGDRTGALWKAIAAAVAEDATDWTARGLAALKNDEAMADFLNATIRHSGEIEFTLIETATFFQDLGLNKEAARILHAAYVGREDAFPGAPLPFYYLAYYNHLLGLEGESKAFLKKAASLQSDYVHPSRLEALAVLEYAIDKRPKDANAHLILGHLHGALGRIEEAVARWERAAKIDGASSVAWRMLGFHAWKKEGDLEKAEKCYRKALKARPDDQTLYRDLARILEGLDRREEGIMLVEALPTERTPRHDAIQWLAQAYVDEERYDDCIAFLEQVRFSNWEGRTRPRDIFVTALMARGKQRFEANAIEAAAEDFQRALTYPENLEVGARYALTDAETRYWLGKSLMSLGKPDEARQAWKEGASQVTSKDMPMTSISLPTSQDEYVARCAAALEVLDARE